MRSYTGSCHCGAVRFDFRSEEISTACRCNCSICRRKAAIMSSGYYPPEVIQVHGLESLSVYRFGDKMVNHYFCPRCGVYPFHDATTKPGHYRVNLGCVEGVDTWALRVTDLDGQSF